MIDLRELFLFLYQVYVLHCSDSPGNVIGNQLLNNSAAGQNLCKVAGMCSKCIIILTVGSRLKKKFIRQFNWFFPVFNYSWTSSWVVQKHLRVGISHFS